MTDDEIDTIWWMAGRMTPGEFRKYMRVVFASIADTAGAKPIGYASRKHLERIDEKHPALIYPTAEDEWSVPVFAAPPAPSSDTAGARPVLVRKGRTARDDIYAVAPADTARAKPTCVHAENPKACYRVRCQLGKKCIDDDLSFRAPPAPSVADAQDAARWREMLKHIGMWLSGGRRMVWAFGDGLPVPRETDYYKDSAAERFSQAIDAAIAKESGND